ncbi:MLP-like protein 28 [Chenopodium quinoa]|uniref:MLP-like protein 28 n=1 Tax=Chenopodium quinoa TaxID=63459 RepID=UPI000B794B7A|nr:MLP-like protein 28 [Chenopodium quinoa]
MSNLKRKLEGEVEIRETGADAQHDIFKNKIHHVSNVAPHFVHGVDLHEGDHGNIGSIHAWNYTLGGKPMVAKSVLEEIDEEKKLIRYRAIEGDVLNEYKTMVATCQVKPKDKERCIVRWSLEYEKKHPGVPEPTDLLDAWLAASKDIDDHHHGKN